MNRDGHVRWERPRRRRPDDHARLAGQRTTHQRKLHVDRRIGALDIFHLRLRQRRLRAGAPKDGLLRLIDQALFHEDREGADDLGLVAGVEREIRVFPIAKDAEPLELPALDVDELARVFLALAPDFDGRQAARFLHHLELDRQPVAVPARHERRAKTRHRFRFHDQILEDLVQRGAHVDIAIRERRAVVQDEKRRVFPRVLDAPVKPRALPLRQPRRFAGNEVRLHREIRLWQEQSVFVIHRAVRIFRKGRRAYARAGAGSNMAAWPLHPVILSELRAVAVGDGTGSSFFTYLVRPPKSLNPFELSFCGAFVRR